MNKILTSAVVLAIILLAFALVIFVLFPTDRDDVSSARSTDGNAQSAAIDLQIEEFAIVGQNHIRQGESGGYNSDPPTSGGHFGTARPWGVFGQRVADEGAVHNLEHGGVWITYDPDLDTASVKQLRDIAARYPNAVLMSPRPQNDSPIAIVSWGRMMKLDTVNAGAIDLYIQTYVNDSPEQFASLQAPQPTATAELEIGKPFPSFELTELNGTVVTPATLSGKPSIVWFTTGWCVPCQIGAKRVAELDAELGGDAISFIVVFVDPQETTADLRRWRDEFAAPQWQVAFDNQTDPLAAKVGLQYLDSKYLLDANGLLLNQDFRIADDAYLEILRAAVKGS